jgi:hypothetical protein
VGNRKKTNENNKVDLNWAGDKTVGGGRKDLSPVIHRDQTLLHTLIYYNLIVGRVYEAD